MVLLVHATCYTSKLDLRIQKVPVQMGNHWGVFLGSPSTLQRHQTSQELEYTLSAATSQTE